MIKSNKICVFAAALILSGIIPCITFGGPRHEPTDKVMDSKKNHAFINEEYENDWNTEYPLIISPFKHNFLMTATEYRTAVSKIYKECLQREATEKELTPYSKSFDRDTIYSMTDTDEGILVKAYIVFLNRHLKPEEREGWLKIASKNGIKAALDGIARSPEARNWVALPSKERVKNKIKLNDTNLCRTKYDVSLTRTQEALTKSAR